MLSIKLYIKSIILFCFQLIVIIKTKISKLKGDKIILYCGQVHSPHFKSFISQLEKSQPHKYITACTYPYNNPDLIHSIYDISFSNIFFKKNEIDIFLSNIYNNAKNPIFGIKGHLKFLINFIKPDIIWLHELQSTICAIDILDIKYSPKIFATVYGNDIKYFIDIEKHKVLIRNLIKKTQLFHVETLREKKILIEEKYNNHVVIGSATLSEFKNKNKLPTQIKKIDFLIKGGNNYRSSSNNFYELIKFNHAKFLDLTFVIFDCDEYDKFKYNRLKEKYNLNLTVLERLNKTTMEFYLSNSKFLFMNSYSDGMSNLVYESWTNRCCVITTYENGFSELYSNQASEKLLFNVFPSFDYFIRLVKMYNSGLFNSIIDENLDAIKNYYSDNVIKKLSNYMFNEYL